MARFEAFVENLIEGPFARLPGSSLQPVQIAKALTRAMADDQAIGPNSVYVPNEFAVELTATDYAAFEPVADSLARELATYVEREAAENGWAFLGPVAITLRASEGLKAHRIKVRATRGATTERAEQAMPTDGVHFVRAAEMPGANSFPARRAAASITVVQDGAPTTIPLTKDTITLGRDLDNDVVVGDPSVSRHHAEIRVIGGRWLLVDLHSTNGTRVNGSQVSKQYITDGDRIRLGTIEMIVHLTPPGEDAL
ncbi:MAG: FhaA domain-containing protein [Chloroflexota bacterium]